MTSGLERTDPHESRVLPSVDGGREDWSGHQNLPKACPTRPHVPSSPRATLPCVAAPPPSVDWDRLTPKGRETATRISLREANGYSYGEIAVLLDAERDQLTHLNPPPGQTRSSWISAKVRELKDEIRAQQGAAD